MRPYEKEPSLFINPRRTWTLWPNDDSSWTGLLGAGSSKVIEASTVWACKNDRKRIQILSTSFWTQRANRSRSILEPKSKKHADARTQGTYGCESPTSKFIWPTCTSKSEKPFSDTPPYPVPQITKIMTMLTVSSPKTDRGRHDIKAGEKTQSDQ